MNAGVLIIFSSILNSASLIPLCQCPVIRATNTIATKMTPTLKATVAGCQADHLIPGFSNVRVPFDGQAFMQSMHPLQAGLKILLFLWTDRWDGQIWLHFKQLVQVSALRLTNVGLNKAMMPIKAP